ncbi:hypothetical protein PFISCL1PPCAC_24046 [Pristionchus fissidentatus]|uniref:Peptidase S1 domain-containing protein n=1 Tax=Pristionchus fissidentatus TaxID=1538716 RepID=A0AAV5WKX9_9BILA|nr:hypothetical protein PFISCL1PPCAC_24046 [Pristionchus fissidentatus]
MRSLLLLSSLLFASHAILNGHADKWSNYAHLVKILSRSSPDSSPLSCSGTLISPRLILTSSHCVMEGGKKLSEILISLSRPSKTALRKRASILLVNGTTAYLSLTHPIKPKEICPGGVPSGRVARLSITPSLTQSSIHSFDFDKIDSTTCRMVAFKSVENVDDFLSNLEVETAVMKVEVEKESLTMRRIDTSIPAPCFEDAGAPFECLVGDEFIQVGLLSSLLTVDDGKEHRFKRDDKVVSTNSTLSTTTTPSTPTDSSTSTTPSSSTPSTSATDKTESETTTETSKTSSTESSSSFSRCLSSSSSLFSRLDSSIVAEIIEKHDFAAFVRMHEECGNGH